MTDIPKGFKGNAVRWVVVKNKRGANDVDHLTTPPPHTPTPAHLPHKRQLYVCHSQRFYVMYETSQLYRPKI